MIDRGTIGRTDFHTSSVDGSTSRHLQHEDKAIFELVRAEELACDKRSQTLPLVPKTRSQRRVLDLQAEGNVNDREVRVVHATAA